MNMKFALGIVALFVAMIICGCYLLSGSSRCVSEYVTADSPLREFDRQMCLAALSGKDLEYWIDGERETPGCHWHLTHIECQSGGCLYRSSGTEHLWLLSLQGNSDLKMTKLDKTSTFQQTYVFSGGYRVRHDCHSKMPH